MSLLNFTCAIDQLERMYFKQTVRNLRKFSKANTRDSLVQLPKQLKLNLQKWLLPLALPMAVLWRDLKPTVELFTNASEEGRSFRICAKVFDQVNGHGTGKMTT